jgi:hypothetical protein
VPLDDEPICRAAIRDGRITLNRWTSRLIGGGPAAAGLGCVTAALADLRVPADGELIVTPVASVAWTAAAEEALLAWARLVGYRRVWLPGRVADLAGDLAQAGVAGVDCPTCGARWQDATIGFWEGVRAAGWFPATCLACGGSLPEWSPGGGAGAATAATSCDSVRT